MNQDFVDAFVGCSVGYNYTFVKNKEDEIKQGKNYYLSSLMIPGQLAQFGLLISKINDVIPAHPLKVPVKIACNIGPLLSLPACLLFAAIKQGDYDVFADIYNQTKYSYIQLPATLSGRSVTFFSFLAEHSGDMIRVGVGAAAIGLIVLGNSAYGGAVLAAIAYESLDKMGFVPRRISLFMETYMPTLSSVGLLIGGTGIIRVFSGLALLGYVSSSANRYIHQKVDALFRKYISIPGGTLEEIDAPCVRKEEMTFDQIEEIFDDVSWNYVNPKINPAHCSKWTIDLKDLPRSNHFDEFLPIFDAIDWQSKYTVIRNKLKDDDRFIDFIFEKNPEVKKDDIADDIDDYIKALADEVEMTPEEYAEDWMRQQLVQLIAVLKGEKRVMGSQQDLDEAIQICQVLLPYLHSLDDQVEIEDILLKLAIEGGDYCGRGVKRASSELLWGILQNDRQVEEESDPIKNYELKIGQALQNKRNEILQASYQALMDQLKGIPDVVVNDTHNFDVFRNYLALGFYPLTEYERNRIGFGEIGTWEIYAPHREAMISIYKDQLDDVIHEVGEAEFGIYLYNILEANENLSGVEKAELFDKFQYRNNGAWTDREAMEKFHRLLLVRLGVLVNPESDPVAVDG